MKQLLSANVADEMGRGPTRKIVGAGLACLTSAVKRKEDYTGGEAVCSRVAGRRPSNTPK